MHSWSEAAVRHRAQIRSLTEHSGQGATNAENIERLERSFARDDMADLVGKVAKLAADQAVDRILG
jgi:hypothetical protein